MKGQCERAVTCSAVLFAKLGSLRSLSRLSSGAGLKTSRLIAARGTVISRVDQCGAIENGYSTRAQRATHLTHLDRRVVGHDARQGLRRGRGSVPAVDDPARRRRAVAVREALRRVCGRTGCSSTPLLKRGERMCD